MSSQFLRSFAAGEIAPSMFARVDQIKYQTGLKKCLNWFTRLEGGAVNRAGYEFVSPLGPFTNYTAGYKMVPFVFNDEQAYVLLFYYDGTQMSFMVQSDGFPITTGVDKVITAVTSANPPVVTSVAHGLTNGQLIYVDGVVGMTQLNGRFFQVSGVTADTFTLGEEGATDASGYDAYVSDGTASLVYSQEIPNTTLAMISGMNYAQNADVLTLVNGVNGMPITDITRIADDDWMVDSPVIMAPTIDRPVGGSGSGSVGTDDVRYQVTAVSEENLEESFAGVSDSVAVVSIVETAPDAAKVITAITAANPPQVTSAAHGYNDGDLIFITGVSGMTPVNDRYYEVYNKTANNFKLRSKGANVNGSGWPAYVSGGTVQRVYLLAVTSGVHSLATSDRVTFSDLIAPHDTRNNKPFSVTVTSATTFTLDDQYGVTTQTSNPPAAILERTAITVTSIIFPTATDPVTIIWEGVDGALEYNVYREINGIFGYIGTSATTTFEDLGYTADAFDTPPIPQDFYTEPGDYPQAVSYYQQRKVYGGSPNEPEGVQATRIGLFKNMTKSNPIQSDDAIRFTVAAAKVNAVRHLVEMDRLLIFTQGSVFTSEGDEAGQLTPTAIYPRKRAQHGVGSIPPIPIGDAVVYVQTSGKVLRELLPGAGNSMSTRDLTVFSRHLFRGKSKRVVAWSYAEEPYSIIWGVRADGTMIGCTYLREQEILGFHRHDTGDGDEILDVCCIPENNESAVYLLVRRYDCNGTTRVYCERMATREVDDSRDGRFLDCYVEFDGRDSGNSEAEMVLNYDTTHEAEDSYWLQSIGSEALTFTTGVDSPDIGNAIVLHIDGEDVTCTILQVYSTTEVQVEIVGDVSGLTLPETFDEWDQAVDTIVGLWHLEGREVYACGDGSKLGPFTVTGGLVTLPAPCAAVTVGLQIIADLVTLPLDTVEGETLADKRKAVAKTTLLVEDTNGIQIGTTEDGLQPFDKEWTREWQEADDMGAIYTGKLSVPCGGKIDDDGSVFVRQDSPLPATILGIIPTVRVGRS